MIDYPVLVLKSGRQRPMLNRHPWVFSGGVKSFPKAGQGAIVAVADNQGKVLGYGFYDAQSQIVCRVFHFGAAAENFETKAYWLRKFEAALRLRQQLVLSEQTTTYRLVHAEGDFFPGIIADVYGDTVALQLLIHGTALRKDLLVGCLKELGFHHI